MQDKKKQNELLNRMRGSPGGDILVARSLGMSPDKQHEVHQIELLCQMGRAAMKSESMVRITADGYEHLGVQVGDSKRQAELLESMRNSPNGCGMFPITFGMPADKRSELHQIELLCDMGLTYMKSDSMACLTPEGYGPPNDESARETVQERTPREVVPAQAGNTKWDVFISHATEDKEGFVRPLAKELEKRGISVWLDESELKVGDRLRRSIDHGLKHSRYGIVVLSPSFFEKRWPQQELDGLLAREAGGSDLILPVWHNVDAEGVRAYSPMLADRVATSSSAGVEEVAGHLVRAMSRTPDTAQEQPPDATDDGVRGGDPEIIRRILEYARRAREGEPIMIRGDYFADLDGGEVLHNTTLCVKAGYIIGKTRYGRKEPVTINGLTEKGREALKKMA
ncbi:MAG: toll/interleukin-1 receptor domain-containing protein [Gammaproteobacteria bacterium]|nr:toll/interleukin-1 receptor domain-containing protein [Gammaproteobacteria bacterium]